MMENLTYLVVPAAGQSKRFGLDRPKFLLEHPSGVTMLEKAILGLGDLGQFSTIAKIVVVSTESHFSKVDAEKLRRDLQSACRVEVEFHFLDKPTSSVVETLTNYLRTLDQDVSIVVKDSDNLVSLDLKSFLSRSNAIAYADLADFPWISAPSKSFMELGSGDLVTNFVEKRVISSDFSVGLTKFSRVSDILDAAHSITDTTGELYVSDLVRAMMRNRIGFHGEKIQHYEDWGTLPDWIEYCRTYKTAFVRVEGIVALNDGRASVSLSNSVIDPIAENVSSLLKLESSGRAQLVFISSRPVDSTEEVRNWLESLGFSSPKVMCGLHISQTITISDFSPTNPHPSVFAVNVPRNSTNLGDYLESFS